MPCAHVCLSLSQWPVKAVLSLSASCMHGMLCMPVLCNDCDIFGWCTDAALSREAYGKEVLLMWRWQSWRLSAM